MEIFILKLLNLIEGQNENIDFKSIDFARFGYTLRALRKDQMSK